MLGETGTGKELLAHAILAASLRADKPFVSINAAAILETLLEAEFFGTAPRAFTGADHKGRPDELQIAQGGTLFLLRLMNSMGRAGFIRRLPDGQFAIGHEPLRLAPGYQSSFHLRDIIYPKLETLSEDSGETSSFYIIENDSRVVIKPRRSVRVSIHEGDRSHSTPGLPKKSPHIWPTR